MNNNIIPHTDAQIFWHFVCSQHVNNQHPVNSNRNNNQLAQTREIAPEFFKIKPDPIIFNTNKRKIQITVKSNKENNKKIKSSTTKIFNFKSIEAPEQTHSFLIKNHINRIIGNELSTNKSSTAISKLIQDISHLRINNSNIDWISKNSRSVKTDITYYHLVLACVCAVQVAYTPKSFSELTELIWNDFKNLCQKYTISIHKKPELLKKILITLDQKKFRENFTKNDPLVDSYFLSALKKCIKFKNLN